jgi:hypothetical protein
MRPIPGKRFYLEMQIGREPQDFDLSTCAGAQSLVDVPPSPRTEGDFIKKLLIVVATSLLELTRRLRHHLLAMHLLFVLQWGSGYLTY